LYAGLVRQDVATEGDSALQKALSTTSDEMANVLSVAQCTYCIRGADYD
jgi:hypothetical protein